MSDSINWGTLLSDLRHVGEGEAESGNSPAQPTYDPHNYEVYDTGVEVRAEEMHQPPPHSNTRPVAASPDPTDVPMADAIYPQESHLEFLHRLMQEFGVVLPVAYQSTVSPHFDTNAQASDTHPTVSNLGPSVPVQSVIQPFSPGQDFLVDWAGPNSPALPSRVVPQHLSFPPTGQEQAAGMASEVAFVGIGMVDTLTDHANHDGGQGRHGVGAQHLRDDIDQTVFVRCRVLTCRKKFRNEADLKKHNNTHTGKGLVHSCKVADCKYVGFHPKDLRTHSKTHNKHVPGDPCAVAGCGRSFRRRDNYLRHLRTLHKGSLAAKAILDASDRPGRRPNLQQDPKPTARKPKRSATEASAPRTGSHASGSRILVSPEQRQAPALSYPRALSVPGPDWTTYGASASMTSQDPSLFTPSNAESTSMFDDAALSPGPAYPGALSVPGPDWTTYGAAASMTSHGTSLVTPSHAESSSMFDDAALSPGSAPSYQVLSGPESDWMTYGTFASMESQNASLFTSNIAESTSLFDDVVFPRGPESPFSAPRE